MTDESFKRSIVESSAKIAGSTLQRVNDSTLAIFNRQRVRRINTPLLRRVIRALLDGFLGVESYELGVHFVAEPEMVRLNETFVRHAGSTDVISFDYAGKNGSALHGEIFICVEEAVRQARRFRATWQAELVRYIVHGVLHFRGYDDQRPTARRRMKREENRLLRLLGARFRLSGLARKTTLQP